LFHLVDEFNRLPSRYLHPTWARGWLPEAVWESLQNHKAVEKRLSRLILRRFGLQDSFIFDFDDPLRRLALLAAPDLGRLLMYTGICLNAGFIARTVGRESVVRIKTAIGEQGYRFALRKAPFLIGRMRFSLAGDLPAENFGHRISSCGIICLLTAFSEQPDALKKRLALKLPRERADGFKADTCAGERRSARTLVEKIYRNEVATVCGTCFS